MSNYLTIARKHDGTLLAHVPCDSYFKAHQLAAALHNACPCIVEIRTYYDGELFNAEEC